MSPDQEQCLSALVFLCEEQVRQAGQRYTPGIDPSAPNLKIESLMEAINSVSCGSAALERFQSVMDSFFEAWHRAEHCSNNREIIQARAEGAQSWLSPMLNRLRERDLNAGREWQDRLSDIETRLVEDVAHWSSEESKLQISDSEFLGNLVLFVEIL